MTGSRSVPQPALRSSSRPSADSAAYRPGPYVLDRDRQYGSTRFMAPEEFRRGAAIDERATVFTLGRTAFVFLGGASRGETGLDRWRAGPALHRVALRAVTPDPAGRFASVADLAAAWRGAGGGP